MKISVFSQAVHFVQNKSVYSYGPYVKEMNYWFSEFDQVTIAAPTSNKLPGEIDNFFEHKVISMISLPLLHYKRNSFFQSLLQTIQTIRICFREMWKSDHIHLRCPGNTALLAMIVSSLFPGKAKTIKYAGNWDPKSKQPISYRFQKWWLSNTFLTKNAKVLVYGDWEQKNKNIIPFFTASFSQKERIITNKEFKEPWHFIFCGSLSQGKRPLLAIQIIHKLLKDGYSVYLDMYGDGEEKEKLKTYILENRLSNRITIHGNQSQDLLLETYKRSHFCILPSKSEGWPKALAEAMFFGCIPISTRISCVPWIIGNGERGILIEPDQLKAVEEIELRIKKSCSLKIMANKAQRWSRAYNLERFGAEIHKLL